MKNFTQKFIAHHINPNAPAGGENIEVPSTHFTEPSMEQLVDLIESGEADKSILGENADKIINEVNTRRNFKLPGEFPGSVEEFDKKYNLNNEEVPDFMEIPVVPYEGDKEQAFLKSFTKSMGA
tara:strand:- start:926 stop:1297 length:372 start_codon:yes stop_codon:yes gene_type:complete